ncbi:MAG: Asp-tRNA(Asn)/Glu-tRNA(Gln) amidotransferase subunit GatA [Gammaproteobacteria bacterium]|nr:Asp-tRNA(Asn)/Glu-tRNA(Gln) amidotransferase subunit GatA [Gammaproteobacteria bacterium]
MKNKTIKELSSDLRKKEYSCIELTKYYLQRIKDYNPKLNSFITVTESEALGRARLADKLLASGDSNLLIGIPIAHKDNICTKNIRTTCGSNCMADFVPAEDAHVVGQLQKAAMPILGKTNLDEFAMGTSNERSAFGVSLNPWDLEKVPGGSSGGSAATVAARLAPVATGSDTGGSIRQPATFCGISALRPTYGAISRNGMVELSASLDQIGPMAKSVEDLAILLSYMTKTYKDYTAQLNNRVGDFTVGLPKEYFATDLDPAVASSIDEAMSVFEKLGVKFREISLPNFFLSVATYQILSTADAVRNLAKLDNKELLGTEVKRRMLVGDYVLRPEHYDKYYLQAQKVRRLICQDFEDAFKDVDLLLTPSTATSAFALNSQVKDPIKMYLNDIYMDGSSLAGLPALAIPSGFDEIMPIGFQLIGKRGFDSLLLNVGHQYQQHTDWHTIAPEGY